LCDSCQPFKTGKQAYDRLRWDPRWSTADLVIGYDDRHRGVTEVAFDAFVPDGRIPWHRVVHIRATDRLLWDRKARLDLTGADGAGAPVAARPAARPKAPRVRSGLPFAWDSAAQAWREAARPTAPLVTLTVATWNVLFDDAVPDDVEARRAALVNAVEGIDAEVVVLQEVRPAFATALLASPLVRARFVTSDLATGATIEPYGQLVLSRVGMAAVEVIELGSPKRAVLVDFDVGGARWQLCAVHLTSDRSENARPKRQTQLHQLLTVLDAHAAEVQLIAGDFNADDTELAPLRRAGCCDVWALARPSDPGHSFDPVRNARARDQSTTGLARRFDRVFVRRRGDAPVSALAELFGQQAGHRGMPLSDHFGLRCALRFDVAATGLYAPPSYRSAVIVAPPDEVLAPIQAIRRAHDRGYARWMPHLNLLYGFVPDTHFAEAREQVSRALMGLAPFEVDLARFGVFAHERGAIVYLDPDT